LVDLAIRALGRACEGSSFLARGFAARGLGLEDFMTPLERAGYRSAGAHAELVDRMRRGVIPPHTVWPNLLFEPRD
jgi:hypothetical protein